MKIVFLGSVEIGLKCLKQVIRDRRDVAAIFTLAKRYAANTSGYVDFLPTAKRNGIKIFKVKNFNSRVNIDRIRKIKPDLIIICGCQNLICRDILDIPRLGAIGFHSSLLPKYKGRAPVNWAMIKGETRTGVTMFYCIPEADAGDIIAQKGFPITIEDTCKTVYDKSANASRDLLHAYLPKIEDGTVRRKKNISSRYPIWPKRKPEDGRIDWTKTALEIHNWIRALTRPYPGAFTYCDKTKYFIWGSRLCNQKRNYRGDAGKVARVAKRSGCNSFLVGTGKGSLWVCDITKEGGRTAKDIVLGTRFS